MCKGTKNNSNYHRNSPKLLTNEEFLDLCIPSSSITVTVVMISSIELSHPFSFKPLFFYVAIQIIGKYLLFINCLLSIT